MEAFSNYETPLWTLIGVAIGFIISFFYTLFLQRKEYNARTQSAINRIKKVMHLGDLKQATQRLADLTPQFKEREQIIILKNVGFESSLNANMNEITDYIIEELRWICILYEVDPNNAHKLVKKSRKDKKRVEAVRGALWEISVNVVEYTQSEELLENVFSLLDTLNNHSLQQGYREVMLSSILLYKNIGELSIGIEYAETGYKVLNFQFGMDESIKQLQSLQKSISQSSFNKTKVSELIKTIENAIKTIEKERTEKIVNK